MKTQQRILRRVLCLFVSLFALRILGLADPVTAEPVNKVQVEGHRCLVTGPAVLSDDAPVVFILHGLGANAENLFGLIEKMNLPPCRYVLPDAPLTIGDRAYAWYNFQTQDRQDMENSRDYLFTLMKRFSAEGEEAGHARPIVLMGFSQGGVMSLEAGLNYPGKISAIVSMSGYICYPDKTLAHPSAPLSIPILLVHGTHDGIVTEEWTQKTVKALKQAGYHPAFKEFTMGHQITPDSLTAVSKFLQEVLAHPAKK
jgi:phospholipase/carboxylesterase